MRFLEESESQEGQGSSPESHRHLEVNGPGAFVRPVRSSVLCTEGAQSVSAE